jgi:hypothetical protein
MQIGCVDQSCLESTKEKNGNRKSSKKINVPLNPHHSHFIFVDDGSTDKFGVEIEFRAKLEGALKDDKNIPMVLIVVGGGLGTLRTVKEALEHKTPIILIAVFYFSGIIYQLKINLGFWV